MRSAERKGSPRKRSLHLMMATLFLACGGLLGPSSGGAEERNTDREAVQNLEAYAAYKAGHYDDAKVIWEALAEKGNTTALINLANMFQQGQGVTEDQKQGMQYVIRAAELGDARAQFELGIAYEKGVLVPRDIALASKWLKASAEQGYSDGQFAYGVMVATAFGTGLDKATKDQRAEALEWLKKAGAQRHIEAADYIKILSQEAPPAAGK